MTEMARVKMRWNGLPGGPGYSIFHFRDFSASSTIDQAIVDGSVAKVQAFATALKPLVAHIVTLQVENDVEIIEDTNGNLVNVMTTAAQTAQVSTAGSANYSALSGAVITWRTAGIVRNRRVRGRTFLVPFATASYQTDGTLSSATVTALQNAGAAMINAAGSGDLGVYSRPSAPGANDGSWWVASGVTVPDMCTVLRSRRG